MCVSWYTKNTDHCMEEICPSLWNCLQVIAIGPQSTLAQVMAWCHQASSHYLTQCWPRSMTPYGDTWPWCVNKKLFAFMGFNLNVSCALVTHPHKISSNSCMSYYGAWHVTPLPCWPSVPGGWPPIKQWSPVLTEPTADRLLHSPSLLARGCQWDLWLAGTITYWA